MYEGTIHWGNHSYYLQDDEYSFALYRDDLAGMTKLDVEKGDYLHSEFNSDQTVNYFHTWYWDVLHQAVDADAGKGGIMSGTQVPPYTRTRALFDGKEAIVMGLYGLDCAHDCTAELHPVYALAIHVNDDLNDDVWAVFVRNWGDEGYCSSGQERIQPDQPFKFSFRFKRPGASAVSLIPGDTSDPQGQRTTAIDADFASPDTGWSAPVLIPSEGAVVTFFLPPSSRGNRINGMLHFKWSVTAPAGTPLPRPAPLAHFVTQTKLDDPEEEFGKTLAKLTPEQRANLERSLATPQPQPPSVRLAPRQPGSGPQPSRLVTKRTVIAVPDQTRAHREQMIREALKSITPP
jgi:hypothetical protein